MQTKPKILTVRVACENIRLLSEQAVYNHMLPMMTDRTFVDQVELRRCLTWCIERCIRETYNLPITGPDYWIYHQVYLRIKSSLEVQISAAIGFNFFSAMVEPNLIGIIYYDNYMELVINNANSD